MIPYKLIHPNAQFGAENKKTDGSVGYDLYTVEDIKIPWQGAVKAKTGICLDMSNADILSYYAEVVPRSSLYFKYAVMMTNGIGIIDSDYQGEILIPLIYVSHAPAEEQIIPAGTAIAQLIFKVLINPKLKLVDEFDSETQRGARGFGSTDRPIVETFHSPFAATHGGKFDHDVIVEQDCLHCNPHKDRPDVEAHNFFPLGIGFTPFPFFGPYG